MKAIKFKKPDPAQLSALVGLLLAMVIAVLANVIAARRFTRWDWTQNGRYTLTPATLETLHGLTEPIQVWVLLGSADPIEQSVKQLLVSYQAETTKLDIHTIDPDRDLVALEDVKKRFKIETGRTEEGHVVADAIVVIARGDRHWFLTTSDMVEVAQGDDTRVKPKEERAFTGAIRNVLGSSKTALCFTSGHGEMSPDDPGREGSGLLKDVLTKDNYEVTVVDPTMKADPFANCAVVIVAGPRSTWAKEEAERLRTFLLGGGNLLLAAGPLTGQSDTGMLDLGLSRALTPFGIALDETLVVEDDPEAALPDRAGIRFMAAAQQHPVTAALVKDGAKEVPRVVVEFARSLRHAAEPGSATPSDLLSTTAKAFGVTNISGAADWKGEPSKKAGDLAGPLVVGMAAERPKVSPNAPHGPRVVVLGTSSPLASPAYREPLGIRGAALLAENAVSWLASQPQVLDVPDRTAVPAGMRLTDDDRSAVRRYVLFLMPGTVALLGLAIAMWRRRTEDK